MQNLHEKLRKIVARMNVNCERRPVSLLRKTPPTFFAICLTLTFGSSLVAQLPEGITDTQPGGEPPPTPEESLGFITVPEGFHVSLFAGEPDVAQPIAIEYDDRGRLWVLESFSYIEWKRTGQDRLLIFEDTDNDGTFDSRKIFWDKGNHTSGFQLGFGGVWLCDAPELLFIPDANRDDIPDGEPRVELDGWTTEAEHNFFNGLTWGPDGWLYGRHGIKKPSKVGRPGTPEDERVDLSCGIWRFHPTKKRFEVWADGTVNPWGLDWNAEGEGFLNTSVIDHLWHLVPGARYRRTPGQGTVSLNPHSYDLMEPTSNHRHWSGGETGRKDFGSNEEAGGGHSHCGMVIYQSDSWPEPYRGAAFFSNVLGQRINMDHLEQSGSAWTAAHGLDFLQSTSEWFRAVDLKQGPYGEMMIAEWTDLGECHDRDGIHRSSGRLYELWYGDRPGRRPVDVSSETSETLLGLLEHENAWWRRHALRNLHERVARGEVLSSGQVQTLVETMNSAPVRDAISAIQALHAIDPLGDWMRTGYDASFQSVDSEDRSAIRTHILTLSFTEETPSERLIEWSESAIERETDLSVLYRMAALLQRIPVDRRWNAAALISRIEIPPKDRNFALMRWYGFEPLVGKYPEKCVEVALEEGHPYLSQAIARRAVAAGALPDLISALREDGVGGGALLPVLDGILEALPARAEMPDNWDELYRILNERSEPETRRKAFQLAQRFGDPVAEAEMVALVLNETTPAQDRLEFFRMLVSAQSKEIAELIPELLADPALADDAIRAEAVFPSEDSAARLIELLDEDHEKQSSVILETLASRQDFSDALVDAIVSGRISGESIPAYVARQIALVTSKKDVFAERLGVDQDDAAEKAKLVDTWKKRLSDEYLANADIAEGREVYRRTCAACHTLYGEGGDIGPDLTGSGRADLDYFLINVLFPSEDVSPDYRLTTIRLKDGRTLSGNIAEENGEVVTFRLVGQTERIDASEILEREVSDVSLMPPGLLDALHREDVRDLVAYLRTDGPLAD